MGKTRSTHEFAFEKPIPFLKKQSEKQENPSKSGTDAYLSRFDHHREEV